ncbi:TPA: hypothetical protein I9080_002139 [Clostridium perfringens]|uniref:Uncharacterized protein n=2 Tax=Clostridium perfringens TaxID=1502 RepID=A0A8H9UX71_CLOPF|nr:hypothetical protein [Clostridium perfringens]EDT15791.1 hypothetical protein AC3_A0226 [Clostridium perfringens E str. JGS1987]EGS5729795.1 hypothetical protein [Clostridium perfringens]EGT0014765.1 hypothetical protein [Clostridium perfringens]MDU3019853.1 hypothetical protein [Clostridium perfringens]HAT4308329.1 hypothetical protein [Clostridium perfringens]
MQDTKKITITIDKENTILNFDKGDINKLDIIFSIFVLSDQLDDATLDLLIKKLELVSKKRKKNNLNLIK